VGRQVGRLDCSGEAPHSPEVQACATRATASTAGGVLEEGEELETRLRSTTARFSPIYRRPTARRDESEADNNRGGVRLGNAPARAKGLQEHWQIAEEAGPDRQRALGGIAAEPLLSTLLGRRSAWSESP